MPKTPLVSQNGFHAWRARKSVKNCKKPQIEGVYKARRSSGPKGVSSHFGALGVEVAVEGIYRSLKDEAAVGAAFKVTLDLSLYDRRQAPL